MHVTVCRSGRGLYISAQSPHLCHILFHHIPPGYATGSSSGTPGQEIYRENPVSLHPVRHILFVTAPDAFHIPGIATDPMSAYYGAAYGAVPWTCFQPTFVFDFIIDTAIHNGKDVYCMAENMNDSCTHATHVTPFFLRTQSEQSTSKSASSNFNTNC